MPILNAVVYANGALIGHADLHPLDPPMGIYGGRFHPGVEYRTVRPVVLELMRRVWTRGHAGDTGRLLEAYRQHDALAIEVRTPEGETLHPVTVHIEDAGDLWRDMEPRIELLGLSSKEVRLHFGGA